MILLKDLRCRQSMLWLFSEFYKTKVRPEVRGQGQKCGDFSSQECGHRSYLKSRGAEWPIRGQCSGPATNQRPIWAWHISSDHFLVMERKMAKKWPPLLCHKNILCSSPKITTVRILKKNKQGRKNNNLVRKQEFIMEIKSMGVTWMMVALTLGE